MRQTALSLSAAAIALAAFAMPAAAGAQAYSYYWSAPQTPAPYYGYGYSPYVTYAAPSVQYVVPSYQYVAPTYQYAAPAYQYAAPTYQYAAPAPSYPVAYAGAPRARTGYTTSAAFPSWPAWGGFDWASFDRMFYDMDRMFDSMWASGPAMAGPVAGAGAPPRGRVAGAGARSSLGFGDFDSDFWSWDPFGDLGPVWAGAGAGDLAGNSASAYSYVHTVNYGGGNCVRTMRNSRAGSDGVPYTVTHTDHACSSTAPAGADVGF